MDIPGKSVYLPLPGAGIWTDCGVDWNVCRLDRAEHCLYDSVPQTEMA